MPRITEVATVAIDPDSLWGEIGGFGSVGEWHPLLRSVDLLGEGTGATRIAHSTAGTDQIERLEALDPHHHLYRYRMERTPMPVRDYIGELRVDPFGESASTVTWSAQFELTPAGDGTTIESVRRFLHAGTESLKHRYGETT